MGSGGAGGAGGASNNAFIGQAMAQAAKMFDQHDAQGNVQSGSKQQAIQSAAQMAMKLLNSGGGGGNAGSGGSGLAGLLMGGGTGQGGGAASLMSLASKLL